MARNLKISKEYVYKYLDSLQRAGLLSAFLPADTGYRLVRKPAKLYIENTNLLKVIAGEVGGTYRLGAARETFFANQMKSAGFDVRIPSEGDFLVNGRYLFEIGGKSKKRIGDHGNAHTFTVQDDLEVGFGNVLPLWLFGFLY